MNEKQLKLLGQVASVAAVLMYVFYVPQIMDNLNGHKGNPLQPFVAAFNCVLWVGYGFFKQKKDWPIIIANLPGILFGLVAGFTAL